MILTYVGRTIDISNLINQNKIIKMESFNSFQASNYEPNKVLALEQELLQLEEEAKLIELHYYKEYDNLSRLLKKENQQRLEFQKQVLRLKQEAKAYQNQVNRYFTNLRRMKQERQISKNEESKFKPNYELQDSQRNMESKQKNYDKQKEDYKNTKDYQKKKTQFANKIESQQREYDEIAKKRLYKPGSQLTQRINSSKKIIIQNPRELFNTKSSKIIKLFHKKNNQKTSDRNEYFE